MDEKDLQIQNLRRKVDELKAEVRRARGMLCSRCGKFKEEDGCGKCYYHTAWEEKLK